ncbi:MAG: ribulose 1,5-bisphosphate carboxylase [Rhizobiales bacterium PAR1]|nr:MAG: ribulose 1,5-bisphosphate carboxylase [Rhizobiales bacterium PAR1]
MQDEVFEAAYLVETPLDIAKVAEVMAGEQSCGTFARVAGETDELRARARARVIAIEPLDESPVPSLHSEWLRRKGIGGPYRRARVRIEFPVANVGINLATLASVVAGNLYDLGETTGLRLDELILPAAYRKGYLMPKQGIAGTRRLTGVAQGPLLGTIIKPNVGLSSEATADLVAQLCDAGLDFIKDDEISANPHHAPLSTRIPAVMDKVRRYRDKTGKAVMMSFNITDETDAMRRHADLVAKEEGTSVMVSINWCGFSAVETLRRHTDLALHAHRNGYGALARHPMLGISFQPYQALWRLAGVDHMHVYGLDSKFVQTNEEVIDSAAACLYPLAEGVDDAVMPAFSSGQWAGTVPQTYAATGSTDLLFMAGGGVLAHPDGPEAGVISIRQAWEATIAGEPLDRAATSRPELAAALAFFSGRT